LFSVSFGNLDYFALAIKFSSVSFIYPEKRKKKKKLLRESSYNLTDLTIFFFSYLEYDFFFLSLSWVDITILLPFSLAVVLHFIIPGKLIFFPSIWTTLGCLYFSALSTSTTTNRLPIELPLYFLTVHYNLLNYLPLEISS